MLNLTLARVPQHSVVDLTQEGVLDWVHWGLDTEASVTRKAGVTPQIGDFEVVWNVGNPNAWAMAYRFNDHYNGFSWSDGTPVTSVTDTTTGVWAYGIPMVGTGFRLAVPAGTALRTLNVYAGVFGGRGKLVASLSDGSARDCTNTDLANLGNGEGGIFTINYAANAPGQTLHVTWTLYLSQDPQANVTLEAAALASPGANNPPFVRLSSPLQNDQFAAGSSMQLTAQASDLDGAVKLVEFFDGATKLGQASAEPFSMTWSNAPIGLHVLKAQATDDQGAAVFSAPVEVFVYAGGGSLTGRLDMPPGATADLTSAGTLDWVHWGLETFQSVNRKAGVTPEVGPLDLLGSDPIRRYTNNFTAFSWFDGVPVGSVAGTTTGIFQTGADGGFQLSVPAGSRARRVQVYVGLYGAQSEFQAYLSDLSGAAYVDTSVSNVYGDSHAVYTLDYQAASDGQSLILRHRARHLFDGRFGNVTLQAVTLAEIGPAPPEPVVLLNPVLSGEEFGFSFLTETGRTYAVQWAEMLGQGMPWSTWTNMAGTGGAVTIRAPCGASVCRFYRVAAE